MIRLLLVDDQHLVRAGLRMLCEAAPDVEVVGEAENGSAAVRYAREVLPDVVLMDLNMPGMNGIVATERILAARPSVRVVVLTTFDDDHLYAALRAGACGFLVKDAAPAELLDGVRRAANGESPFSADVLGRLVATAVGTHAGERAADPVARFSFTGREREVLELVSGGLSNGEIAQRLGLGVTTVKTYVTSLLAKIGAPNRVRLAVLAVRAGIGRG
ncbi:response regulator transcription factor [Plantactinospora sp. KLBMP9567]|uniref:response regulator transcription factor n=1 Tax=Plantactinospora sp. KLBMP9567 TaxID=3085900 RepID=UPI0029811AFF|nr:response regulator transcription factor [Plantactinospora sp. KLBMP9567]MDW5322363.1 response regulator transcription factor [Plantactinospora sp. KLBMP9567]